MNYHLIKNKFEKVEYQYPDLFDIFLEKIIINNGATLLNKTIHHFNDNGAFTALYLLAESHLSIHTWPENNFIAIDIFTCGKANTHNISNELKIFFEPQYVDEKISIRGNKI